MKLLLPFLKRKDALSRKQYWKNKIIWWLYTVIWITLLIFIWFFWNASLWCKFAINFALIILTPALSDLFKSYEKCKREWEEQYKK